MYPEGRREIISVLVGSFLYAFVAVVLVAAGAEKSMGTLWTLVLSGLISGIANFFISYYIAFKLWDWIYVHRSKILTVCIILLIIMFTQWGKVI